MLEFQFKFWKLDSMTIQINQSNSKHHYNSIHFNSSQDIISRHFNSKYDINSIHYQFKSLLIQYQINVLICTKSSDQGLLQRGDQAACKRVRLSRTRISSDQGPFLSAIKQSRWIPPIKNLDPGCNGSTGATSVITPCWRSPACCWRSNHRFTGCLWQGGLIYYLFYGIWPAQKAQPVQRCFFLRFMRLPFLSSNPNLKRMT